MKQIKIVLLMVLLTGLCSCRKNLLDIQPSNLLTNDQIVASDASVIAYVSTLYRDLPIEDFQFVKGVFWTFPDNANQYTANWSDEAQEIQGYSMNGQVFDALYQAVRNANTFIQLMGTATAFTDAQKTAYIAEGKFIRAYYYFALVKYWGGVPLVLNVPATPVPLPRNKETEIYDQIKKDLEDAEAGMPADQGYGRANKYVAYALEARAMLHAGSIGLFGPGDAAWTAAIANYNGVVGVDPAHATVYMQAAFDASAAVINSNKYSLYTKYFSSNPTDQAKNFEYMLYDAAAGVSNTEAIFNRGYDPVTSGGQTHSEDLVTLPHYICATTGGGNSNHLQPTLDMMERFENLDGSSPLVGGGVPNVQYHFAAMTTPFANKEPRYHGSIISNGTFFKTDIITAQKGVILNNQLFSGSNYLQYFDLVTHAFTTAPPTTGNAYVVGTGNSSYGDQSAWIKKWTDPVAPNTHLDSYQSLTSWIDMRLGEVLLDYAEASFELGHTPSEALGAVNKIRARAGVPALTSISRAQIRHERQVEFMYENKSWWDYIRWRSFPTDFNNRQEYNLQCWWDQDTKDYVYIKVTDGGLRTYQFASYYAPIPASDLSTNTLLRNNPGY